MDSSLGVLGAKIKNKWYFIFGGTTYYSREAYKRDYTTPFTFEELSYLANKYSFVRNVVDTNGVYKVSDEFFPNILQHLDSSNRKGDSLFLELINQYESKEVPEEELDRIKENQSKSQKPELKGPTLYERLFKKKKLFDSKAWKERRKPNLN